MSNNSTPLPATSTNSPQPDIMAKVFTEFMEESSVDAEGYKTIPLHEIRKKYNSTKYAPNVSIWMADKKNQSGGDENAALKNVLKENQTAVLGLGWRTTKEKNGMTKEKNGTTKEKNGTTSPVTYSPRNVTSPRSENKGGQGKKKLKHLISELGTPRRRLFFHSLLLCMLVH